MRAPFRKTLGSFDRIELNSEGGVSEWLTLTMHVGNGVGEVRLVLRSDEAVRDLHYALGRYLEHIGGARRAA